MLYVILTILKIIGIVILCIIGLIIVLLCTILFVPVRYKINAEVHSSISVKARITWLLHIFSIRFAYYNGELTSSIRIFGVDISRFSKKKLEDLSEKVEDFVREDLIQEDFIKEDLVQNDCTGDSFDENGYNSNAIHKTNSDNNTADNIMSVSDDIEKENTSTATKNIFVRIKNKIVLIYCRICDIIKAIYRKLVEIKDNFIEKKNSIVDFVNDDNNKQLYRFLKKQLSILLKHVKPRRYRIYVKYGSNEPDITGKVIMYVAMANAMLNLKLDFIPVFGESIFECEGFIKGRVMAYKLLLIALRVYMNKQFKLLLKKFS